MDQVDFMMIPETVLPALRTVNADRLSGDGVQEDEDQVLKHIA